MNVLGLTNLSHIAFFVVMQKIIDEMDSFIF